MFRAHGLAVVRRLAWAATVCWLSDPAWAAFDFCTKAALPACVDDNQTYASHKALLACQTDIQRYVDTVLAYRICLAHSIERANLEANMMLHRFRCRSNHERDCYRPAVTAPRPPPRVHQSLPPPLPPYFEPR